MKIKPIQPFDPYTYDRPPNPEKKRVVKNPATCQQFKHILKEEIENEHITINA
jgi:hypothetical protein